jgi:tRNA(Ile)-lysidine synthase TilS/MesJ
MMPVVVNRAALTLKIPCHTARARVIKVKQKLGLSLEEAGRRVRYAFFNRTMVDAGYNKLALGHQSDDNAEQMLMALVARRRVARSFGDCSRCGKPHYSTADQCPTHTN